jgi:hypothetical protein
MLRTFVNSIEVRKYIDLISDLHGSHTHSEMEDDMENAVLATTILFQVMGGLGLFFIGVGVLWFVDVYKKKEQ